MIKAVECLEQMQCQSAQTCCLQRCQLARQREAIRGEPHCLHSRQRAQRRSQVDKVSPQRRLPACQADLVNASARKYARLQAVVAAQVGQSLTLSGYLAPVRMMQSADVAALLGQAVILGGYLACNRVW